MPPNESSPINSRAYTALYRRWRPQLFSQVVGQKHVARTLQNALTSERVAHAYLFCGLRGTGKTTMAKLLARALNCQARVGPEPCNNCPSCLEILEGRSVDVLEIDAASNRGIDEIRDLRDKALYATAQSRYKVYIVDEVHMLTNEAFNALLKILEEPPPKVVFILATTEVYKLPLTVVSRCQRFDFHLLESGEIAGHLQNIAATLDFELDSATLYLLAQQAEGSMRDALGFLEQCRAYGGEKLSYSEAREILGLAAPETVFNLLEAVVQEDTGRGLSLLSGLVHEGRDLHRFIRELTLYLRKLVVLQSGENEEKVLAGIPGLKSYLPRHKGKFGNAVLLEMLEILQELTFQLRSSSQPLFLLELTFLRLLRAYRFRQYFSPGSLFQHLEELEEKLQASARAPVPAPGSSDPEPFAALQGSTPVSPLLPATETEEATGGPENTAQQDPAQTVKAEDTVIPASEAADTAVPFKYPDPASGPYTAASLESPPDLPLPGSPPADPMLPDAPPPGDPLLEDPPLPEGSFSPSDSSSVDPPEAPSPPDTRLETASRPPMPTPSDVRVLEGPELQEFWDQELLAELKKQRRHVLHALMLEAAPLSYQEGVFRFTFPPTHTIHKDRVESSRHRKNLESLLSSLLGRETVFRVILQDPQDPNEEKENKKTGVNGIVGTGGKQADTVTPTAIAPSSNLVTPSPDPAAPASNTAAAGEAVPEDASRKKREGDYFMQQMTELFKGKLIAAETEKLNSRDFWKFGTFIPDE